MAALTILSLAILVWLSAHYFSICPRVPDLQTGHVFPLDNHGAIVYLTKSENFKMLAAKGLFLATWLAFVAFTAVSWGLKK
ncbi:MAG TPA: hypothetical protein VF753_16650 [Terriglobales bacterium]